MNLIKYHFARSPSYLSSNFPSISCPGGFPAFASTLIKTAPIVSCLIDLSLLPLHDCEDCQLFASRCSLHKLNGFRILFPLLDGLPYQLLFSWIGSMNSCDFAIWLITIILRSRSFSFYILNSCIYLYYPFFLKNLIHPYATIWARSNVTLEHVTKF